MTPEERLERGEILTFLPCPFPLPSQDDWQFLFQQRIAGPLHKNISFETNKPGSQTSSTAGRIVGLLRNDAGQEKKLTDIFANFGQDALAWLSSLLPRYSSAWMPQRITFLSEEEAIRKMRLTARNDLLHFDVFPSRPGRGHRLLRLYVNLHPQDDHVWVTSEKFADVFARYGSEVGLPDTQADNWKWRLGKGVLSLFQPGMSERTPFDRFMLRLHHYLKMNDAFQEESPRHFLHFPPGSAWLAFTDGLCHAELRGRYALEQSFFIPSEALAAPNEAPAAILRKHNRLAGKAA